MATLGKLRPVIVDNRCYDYCKTMSVISRSISKNGRISNSPLKDVRPMVTADEFQLPDENNSNANNIPCNSNDTDEFAEPTNCCMSGCANCVWIKYAETLSEKFKKSDSNLQKIIMDKVQDPNMRAFLSMELRCRNLIKS